MSSPTVEELDVVLAGLPPDPDRMNDRRAARAENILKAYIGEYGPTDKGGEALGNAIAYLLADLLHFCDRKGLDFDVLLGIARIYYREETDPIEPYPSRSN